MPDTQTNKENRALSVVGIGASAGGLKALTQFVQQLPADSGMAFVLVQHLDPDHKSELSELLQNHTEMPVLQVENEQTLEPDRIYVIPPNKRLAIKNGHLELRERERKRGSHAVINLFFRSLAEDVGERAVAIVLSGTGSDGSQGVRAVKEAGGITFAQAAEDAEYDSMPRNAVATGLVDFVLSAAEMPQKLLKVKDNAAQFGLPHKGAELLDEGETLEKIFTQLRQHTGNDFSTYKRSTVLRRIARRMAVHGLGELDAYLEYLRGDDTEAAALVKELLISVTHFFRDPEAFELLESRVIPKLFAQDEVRVWIAGCATGEEAYSVAMLLAEYNALLERPRKLQIFASDLDAAALEFARQGVYPDTIAADVSSARLQRFFEQQGESYKVRDSLRELILFAPHNLIKDPPFSKLQLVTCRNLLIYLNADTQAHVYDVFHYALGESGYLFLGASESLGKASSLFDSLSERAKVFKRRNVKRKTFPFVSADTPKRLNVPADTAKPDWATQARQAVLSQTDVSFAVVDEHHDILYVSEGMSRYLAHPEGEATHNIVRQARQGLSTELRTALYRLFKRSQVTQDKPVILSDEVLSDETANGDEQLSLSVAYLSASSQEHALITFRTLKNSPNLEPVGITTDDELVSQLEHELHYTRESLQTTIEELETSNEELRASNEELQSVAEEMRSTTEELETSREELQSTNEELSTVNQELRNKIEELARTNSDLENLISSTDVGTLFLDAGLRLKRYTPAAAEVFNLIAADRGRPFDHISHKLTEKQLNEVAQRVLDTLQPEEFEAQTTDSRSFIVNVLPYRTLDNRIDGIVLTLVEVTELMDARAEAANRAEQQALIARLGQQALESHDLDTLMQNLVAEVAETLQVDYVKVLELDEDALLLKVGVGWQEGLVGNAKVGTESDSQAGFTLVSNEPVIVENLATETRFDGPALLRDHEVVSGISVIVKGDEAPYGVLGVHTKTPRTFTQDDVSFVQAVANVLAQAVRRDKAETALKNLNTELESRVEIRTSELQSEKEFSEQLIESSVDGILAFDTELRYTVFNEGMRRISGVGAEAALGNLTYEVFPFLEEIGELTVQRATLRGERSVRLDEPYTIPQTGRSGFFEAHYAPLRSSAGEIIGGLAVVRDTTERKNAEDELRASEERFRAVFEQGPSATCLLILDNWIVIDSNDKCEDVLGYKRGELTHKSLLELDLWQDTSELNALENLIDTEDDKRELELHVLRGGELGVLCASLELVHFAAEEHVLLIFDDITERKRVAEELRRAQLKLSEVRDEERLMLARDLHDGAIQELLGINQNLASLEIKDTKSTTKLSAAISAERKNILGTVNQLRGTLSHLRPPGLEDFGLSKTLQSLVEESRARVGANGPELTADIDPTTGLEPQLSRALYRVAQEGLRNALRHAHAKNIQLNLHLEEDKIALSVADDGVGFVRPERLNQFAENDHFGLLGAEERMRLLHGELKITSKKGEGTTLLATVPLELNTDKDIPVLRSKRNKGE